MHLLQVRRIYTQCRGQIAHILNSKVLLSFRSGTNHNFGSMDAAREIGGAVQEKFGWKVKMKGFDIEVVANVDSEQVR